MEPLRALPKAWAERLEDEGVGGTTLDNLDATALEELATLVATPLEELDEAALESQRRISLWGGSSPLMEPDLRISPFK